MKKHFLFIALFFITIFTHSSCIPNLFKNNDSVPSGYEKIDFSAKNDPSELIRDSLDKSKSSLLSLNNIFQNYSLNIIQQMNLFMDDNQNLNSILNENFFSSIVNNLPSFSNLSSLSNPMKSLNNSSYILTATPNNTLDPSIQSDSKNIFTKIVGTSSQVNSLNGIKFYDTNGNIIDNNNITANYTVNTYYTKNLYPSWSFPLTFYNLNNANSSWEFIVQCVSANVTILGDSNTYIIPAWPRISIVLLNPGTKITNKYLLIKNNLLYNNKISPNFIPVGNINQITQKTYSQISNNLIPQSLLFNKLTTIKNQKINRGLPVALTGESYVYFQDGMTSFFSRLLSANLTNINMINTFTSWQTLVNKSWFDITTKLDSSNNIPLLKGNIDMKYLNYQNISVDNLYSNDFKPGGIHYISPTDAANFLPQIPDFLDATSIGLDEASLGTICTNIIK